MWFLLPLFLAAAKYTKDKGFSLSNPVSNPTYTPPIKTGGNIQYVPRKSEIEAVAYGIFVANAKANEGYRLDVYLDTKGIATVGIGHKVLSSDRLKLGDRITPAQAQAFFNKDAATAFAAAKSQARDLNKYNSSFIAALAEVNFQLGTNWKSKFYNTWAYLKSGNFKTALSNLRQSDWMKQTPERVTNFMVAINKTFSTTA